MKINITSIFLLLLNFLSCSEEHQSPPPVSASFPTSTETTLLLFKKEKKIEIWTYDAPKRLIHSIPQAGELKNLSIGQTMVTDDVNLNIMPESEEFNTVEVIVFPNDPRSSGTLNPCFACPHVMSETYAKLELLLKNYPLPK